MPAVPIDPYDAALLSIQRWCMQNLLAATWKETYFARMLNSTKFTPSITLLQLPLVSIVNVKGDDTILVVNDDYEVDHQAAIVRLNRGGTNWDHAWDFVTVEYQAGYASLPLDLQQVVNLAGASMETAAAFPMGMSSIDMPDVGAVRFDYAAVNSPPPLPPSLAPYIGVLSSYRDTSRLLRHPALQKIEAVVAP